MFRAIREIWTGSDPVEFESTFSLDKSVERLQQATRRSAMFATQETAVGKVTQSRVSLARTIPMMQNSFKPIFTGSFERKGGKVMLRGRFTLHWFVKLFLVFWIGIATFIGVVGTLAAMRDSKAAAVPFFTLIMVLFAFGLLRFGAWLSRNDPAWLSAVIRNALDATAATQVTHTATPGTQHSLQKQGRSNLILVASAVMLLVGAMSLVSAVTGIQSYQGNAEGSVVTHFHDVRERYMVASFAVLALVLSFGIFRRSMLAWRLGFVMLAGGWVLQMWSLLSRGDLGKATIPAIVFGAVGAIITVFWGRWWYAQRVHFRD
jgi:hypothetical protein